MKRLSAALLLLCAVFIGLRAANPDFTHPQTTLANAEKNYDSAISSPQESGIKLIKSLLEISGATAAIDRDSLPSVLPRINRAIDACPDGVIKALALTVKAEIIYDIYSNNRWKYDRNLTPDEPLPTDITEWNGHQFKAQITSTINSAFDLAVSAPSAKLTAYSEIIKADRQTLYFLPTLCDFVATKAIDMFQNIGERDIKKNICNRMIDISRYESASWFWWNVHYYSYNSESVRWSDADENTRGSSSLERLYLDHKDSEEAGYALTVVADQYNSIRNAPQWLLHSLKDFISRYPNYILINTIKNRLIQLTNPNVSIRVNDIVAPLTPFEVNIRYDFVKNYGFTIYSISKDTYDKNGSSVIAQVKNVTFKADDSKFNCDTVVSVSLPAAGYYKIVPISNITSNQKSNIFIKCIPFIPTKIYGDENTVFTVVDFNTGAPMSGVKVTAKSRFGKVNPIHQTSDRDGIVKLENLTDKKGTVQRDIDYYFTYKGQTFEFISSGYSHYSKSRINFDANIFTDRQLYHPGDTVRWAAVLYKTSRDIKPILVKDESVQITLYDTNRKNVGCDTATTDDYGRIHGEFAIPDEGLTGDFHILITYKEKIAYIHHLKEKYITVSDFKLPTFKVDSLSVERDRPAKGEVTLGGKAVTYSGMPVSGAKVEVTIYSAHRWYRFSPIDEIGIVNTVTEANGHFSVVVPDSILSKYKDGCYYAQMAVTSTSGETQHASKPFTTGKPYTISYNHSSKYVNTDTPYLLPLSLYDADGKKVDNVELRWWLNIVGTGNDNLSSAVKSGIITTGKNETVDLSTLKSDNYYLSVEPVDTTLADIQTDLAVLSLYSIKNNTVPSANDIFVPKTEYITDNNGEVEILVGTPDEKSYIYTALGSLMHVNSINLEEYSAGFHYIKVKLPEDAKEGVLKIFTTIEGKTTLVDVEIKRPDRRKITLEGSSMRDRLSPGTPERWTLKLTDVDGKPIAGAMLATMFNSAINSLEYYSMPMGFNIIEKPIGFFSQKMYSYPQYGNITGKIKYLQTLNIGQPEFNPSISYRSIMNYGRMMMKSRAYTAAATGSVNGILVTEDDAYVANAQEMVSEDKAVYTMAMVSEDKAVYTMAFADTEEYEEEAFDEDGGSINPEPEFEYRPSEVLQAFWMPELLINENGETEIAFTTPNANTTWSFNAFAWTQDLRATTMIREFVAAKPVMVQPNLPRFLRAGDKARVLATVFNNSDQREAVTTVVELFDFSTGNVYATAQSTDTIAPAASAIVSIMVEATGDASVIGYRVRSTLGKFTDGEQAYIPVEAATSDVIESEVFYLNPGDDDYNMTLPKGKNMQSTLDYTDNPAWNIIKQLPGLAESNASTSTAAALQLFGAATAAGMLKAYPAIAEVLRAWNENPDYKALTSRLSQNDELKAAVLSETPWVQAAASDSHRMARLSLLFDKKATSGSIDAAIATLRKLQRADGGWSWGGWSDKSSLWATNIVLQQLGRLRVAGYLPSGKGLEQMIDKGINYYESKLDKDIKTDRALAYIVSMSPDHKLGLRGTQVVNATLQMMMNGWKSASTWDKAMDALILNASGYPNVAKEIIGSLRQFAVASPSRGTSFPSVKNVNDYADLLNAFATIEPHAPEIDGMRQWLVIREQATEQLGSYEPTRIIAAFTACGSKWLTATGKRSTITAGGTILPTDNAEAVTGHIVCALPSGSEGKQLTVARGDASVPAYGAVISRFVAKSADVKASSCADLSVEKRITALRNGKWQYVDKVMVGEQVRVLLTIKAKRDLEYVTVIDGRPAAFEPVDQLPGWVWSAGAGFYRENRESETRLFINYLPKGTYQITIDMTASIEGTFTSGIATVQSQLAPSITAHSAGTTLICQPRK